MSFPGRRNAFAVGLCAALLSCAHAPPPRGDPTGIAAFTRHSRFLEAKISPNGSYLAAISLERGKRALTFIDLKSRKLASVFRPSPESVGEIYWASDTRAVVSLWEEDGTLAAPVNYGEIYAVDPATARGQMIFGYRADKNRQYAAGVVVGRLRNDERRILIEAADFRDVTNGARLSNATGRASSHSAQSGARVPLRWHAAGARARDRDRPAGPSRTAG
jgi:hypothetical protein